MSSITQLNGWWYLWISEGGKRRKKSLKTQDKAIAKRLQSIYDAKAAVGRTGLSPRKMSLELEWQNFLDWKKPTVQPGSFKRLKNYRDHWMRFFAEKGIVDHTGLSGDIVSEYVAKRKKSGGAEKTIRDEICTMKTVLRHAADEGRCDPPRLGGWPKLKKRPVHPERLGFYSIEEINLLRAHFAGDDFEPVFLIALHTGCRLGEIKKMRVRDVRISEGVFTIPNIKNERDADNATRRVEIHPGIMEFCRGLVAGRPFTAPLVEVMQHHNEFWAREKLRWACHKIGIQYRRFHGIRHTWITMALAHGMTPKDIMDVVGHSNLETLQKYIHSAESLRKGKMAKIILS